MLPPKLATCMASLVFLATTVAAAEEDNFGFNLFSDVAPILALFGEQFARQFLSESMTWLDHLIFAMVPLGILTAITAAIRVQGPQIARAFIGRAKENRALAEIELMSSTSAEVCEMFNGKSIVRVMGNPKIARFLIFPKEYAKCKDNLGGTEKPDDKSSCGIHTLETSVLGGEDEALMECVSFHSHSYDALKNFFRRVKEYISRKKKEDDLEDRRSDSVMEAPDSQNHDQTEAFSNCLKKWFPKNEKKDGRTQETSATTYVGPPNLQLNLSFDHFEKKWVRRELFLAAATALTLQSSLIAIAAVTVFHQPTRSSIGFNPNVYGFPCYAAGSILLSLGMTICSLAVEQSTVERAWKARGPGDCKSESASSQQHDIDLDACPRLVWLQQSQTLSDQAFDSYVILAGPKRYVITSSRIEDVEKWSSKTSEDPVNSRTVLETSQNSQEESASSKIWEFLTVCGVLASGTGFVAQFMGLRGLAFPCSIAHLGAIFLMALVRGLIRRRLGNVPAQCPTLPGYELDSFALLITFYPGFRDFKIGGENPCPPQSVPFLCQWQVETAKVQKEEPFLPPSHRDAVNSRSESPNEPRNQDPPNAAMTAKHSATSIRKLNSDCSSQFETATSQQLLRVRQRLGDLCCWPSKASETALGLVHSIELFMDTFFPPTEEKQLDTLDWLLGTIKTRPCGSRPEERDSITISIRRKQDEKWQVDIGQVDAALSLWMASIEAKKLQKENESAANTSARSSKRESQKYLDWRRAKAGTGMKYSLARILGDDFDDGVLKRDLSWWVDEQVADAATNLDDDHDDSSRSDNVSDESDESVPKALCCPSHARKDNVDLVIGFNSRPCSVAPRRKDGATTKEVAIFSSASLPTALAQHLFMSFMWTVVGKLQKDCLRQHNNSSHDVEVDGRDRFVPYEFTRSWRLPTLRHRQLTKIVRQMEVHGLGTTTDIRLCIIPPLSFRDLLPNDSILNLIPKVGHRQGWAETARCYNQLLGTSIRTGENFCCSVVIAVMDFLYFACEPYDKYITPPEDLEDELKNIVGKLVSEKFVHIVKKLAPVYNLQNRREAFAYVFNQFQPNQHNDDYLDIFEIENIDIDKDFATEKLRFSKWHQRVCGAMSGKEGMSEVVYNWKHLQRNYTMKRDIFGWTPLHYACLVPDPLYLFDLFDGVDGTSNLSLHKVLDTFERSPVHVAASRGDLGILEDLLEQLSEEDRKNALHIGGVDGMTPLHFATRAGSKNCVDYLIQATTEQLVTDVDAWGRTAIHIAASCGGDAGIATVLLKAGSRLDAVDKIENSPLDYVLTGYVDLKRGQDPNHDDKSFADNQTSNRDHHPPDDTVAKDDHDSESSQKARERKEDKKRAENKRGMFEELARNKPDYRAKDGKTFVHLAAQKTDCETICKLLREKHDINARDGEDRTPLHCAILANRPEIVNLLVEKDCEIRKQDSNGRTALHLALDVGGDEMAKCLLKLYNPKDDPHNKFGDSLLHSACKSGCTGAIPIILEKWPNIINIADSRYGQTALAYACECRHNKAVQTLLEYENIDVNKAASNWLDYTPLHFAVSNRDQDILRHLVEKDSIDLNMKHWEGLTGLEMAVSLGSPDCANILLLHKKTLVATRVEYLKLFCSSSDKKFQDLVPEILNSIEGASLTDHDLAKLLGTTSCWSMPTSVETYLEKALRQDSWKGIKFPCHLAARAGSLKLIKLLTQQGANPAELDEDNWSCVDYAIRYGHEQIVEELSDFLLERYPMQRSMAILRAGPTSLELDEFKDSIAVGPCGTLNHVGCQVNDLRVQRVHGHDKDRVCLRSKNCIPPPTASAKLFYFEIMVLENSDSRVLGLGFSDDTAPTDGMPGWFKESWGYHGDDGKLFLESGRGVCPTEDFGLSAVYAAGDVAGVGLNLETGEGFCTLNGERKDVGTAFNSKKFKIGKLYPCIGLDVKESGVGLHVVVNFEGSDRHPFKYTELFV